MALTERLMVLLDAHAGGLISEFSKAAKAADKVESSAKGAKKSVDDVGSGADKTGGLIGKLADKAGISGAAMTAALGTAGVAAAGALAGAIGGAISKFVDLASQVDDFQDVAGGSAEQASRLLNVTRSLGIEPEVASKAFFTLGKNIGSGTSKLDEFGIAVAKNKDGTTDLVGTLANVSAAYQGTADQAEKNAIAAAAFGKAGAGLPDLLSLTRQELEALESTGPVFSQKEVDSAKEFQIQLKQVGLIKDKIVTKGGGFFTGLITDNLKDIKILTGGLVDLTQQTEAERDVNVASAKAKVQASREAQTALDDQRKSVEALRDSLLGSESAQIAYERSIQSVGDAEANVADKRKALNDLLAKGAVDAKAVETATRQLASANRGLASAQERATDARKALDKALAGPTAKDSENAALDLKDANLGVADAQDALADAQKAVTDAQAAGDPEALADANRNLERATINVKRAQNQQEDAQNALNDLNPSSEASTKRVEDAYRNLADANQAVDDAARNVLDSTVALNTARAGDPDFADKVAKAYIGVRDANNGLADAKRNELGALIDLNDARFKEAALLGAAGDNAKYLNQQLVTLSASDSSIAPLLAGLLTKTGVVTTYTPDGRPLNTPTSHAAGGPFSAGEWSTVGEKGPELVRFGRSGSVVPNSALGGTTHITINMPPGSDGDDVVAALNRYKRRNGSLPF